MKSISRAGTARRGGGRGMRAGLCGALTVGALLAGGASASAEITISGPATTPESGEATYTITRTGILSLSDALVTVSTTDGTATAGSDYAAVTTSVTLGPATLLAPATATVKVPVTSDTADEPDETFNVSLSNADTDTIGTPSTVTTTITDDDVVPPVITVGAAPAVGEGAAGAALKFPVTLSAAAAGPVSVHYKTSDGSATAGDYTAAADGTLTIAAGQKTGTISVPVTNDAVNEDPETVGVTISNPTGATLGAAATRSATGTITDDDALTVAVTGAAVAEGAAGAHPVTNAVLGLSTTSSQPVTVNYKTIDGTALAGSDYVAASGTVTVPAGAKTALIPVTINGDATPEPDEVLGVTISSASRGTIPSNLSAAPIVIKNDDGTAGGGTKSPGGVDPKNTGSIGLPGLTTGSKGSLKVSKPAYRKANGTVRYEVRCPEGTGRCKGTLTLFSVPAKTSKVKPLRKEQTLGRKKFDLAAGGTVTITFKLTKVQRSWLKKAKTIKTSAYAVATIAKKGVSTTKVAGTLKG